MNQDNENQNNDEIRHSYEFRLERLETQQNEFFNRTRNCDVKLGILIALISAILLYIIGNLKVNTIMSIQWIQDNGIYLFIIYLLIDIAIVSLLYIALFFALLAIKTHHTDTIGPAFYGDLNLDSSHIELLKLAIHDTEKVIEKSLLIEKKKNKKFDISIILTIISISLIIVEKVIILIK